MSKKKTELDKLEEPKQIKVQKRMIYYQTFLTAWFDNRMELDKQLLVLSTAGTGLLIFFYDRLELTTEYFWYLFLSVLGAGVLFIATIGIILYTFHINSEHIKAVIKEDIVKEAKFNATLERLGNWSRFTFIFAVSVTFILAISSVFIGTVYK